MNTLLFSLAIILSSVFLSSFLTYLIFKKGRNRMLAWPNERTLHEIPTSQGGGLAIVITWYAGITIFFFMGILDKGLYFALLSGALIAFISFLDDIYGIRPVYRLVIHFAAAIIAFVFLQGLRPLILPGLNFNYNFIAYPLAILGIVWFINLYNFMDGIDGFAALESIVIALVLFLFTLNWLTLLLIACVSGFLIWNWPKAKIFLGDTGSTQLGFILIILGIYFHNNFDFSILNWIMLTSPFWFDATLTLYRRWRNGEDLSTGHKKHVYQRLVRMGFSHERVNYFLLAVNCVIILMILIYREIKILQIPLFVLALAFYYLVTLWVDRHVSFGNPKTK